jgi:hypothetical protein
MPALTAKSHVAAGELDRLPLPKVVRALANRAIEGVGVLRR